METAWVTFEDTAQQLYGFKDLKGNTTVSPRFLECFTDTFWKTAFVVVEHEGTICIDKNLNRLYVPYMWDNGIDFYQSGLIRIQDNKRIGFADTTGKIIISPTYDFVTPFEGNYAVFLSDGKYVCWNEKVADSLCEHMRWKGGYWGIINKHNDTVVAPKLRESQLVDLDIATLTTKDPKSHSYISIKGGNRKTSN